MDAVFNRYDFTVSPAYSFKSISTSAELPWRFFVAGCMLILIIRYLIAPRLITGGLDELQLRRNWKNNALLYGVIYMVLHGREHKSHWKNFRTNMGIYRFILCRFHNVSLGIKGGEYCETLLRYYTPYRTSICIVDYPGCLEVQFQSSLALCFPYHFFAIGNNESG